MNRIDEKFQMIKNENKKAFIPYICAGDPSAEDTEKLVYALEEAGADIIELGIPFSDPLADGPVIQAASLRSLTAGFKIDSFFDIVKKIRNNSQIPLVAMVYYSTVFGYGAEKFISLCDESGIDGLIIPDMPFEETDEVEDIIKNTGLYLIPLITVTSDDRIPMLVENARGFIYCVSSLGVTGERTSFYKGIEQFISKARQYTDIPLCIGFGISTNNDVKMFNQYADGCIVGSAIVRKIYESNVNIDEVKAFVKQLIG